MASLALLVPFRKNSGKGERVSPVDLGVGRDWELRAEMREKAVKARRARQTGWRRKEIFIFGTVVCDFVKLLLQKFVNLLATV